MVNRIIWHSPLWLLNVCLINNHRGKGRGGVRETKREDREIGGLQLPSKAPNLYNMEEI